MSWLNRIVGTVPFWTKRQRWCLFALYGTAGFGISAYFWNQPDTYLAQCLVWAFVAAANYPGIVIPYGLALGLVGTIRSRKDTRISSYLLMRTTLYYGFWAITFLFLCNMLAYRVATLPQLSFFATGLAINSRFFSAFSRSKGMFSKVAIGILLSFLLTPVFIGMVTFHEFPGIAVSMWISMLILSAGTGGATIKATKLERLAGIAD